MKSVFIIEADESTGDIQYYVPQDAIRLFESLRDRLVSIFADVTMLTDEAKFPVCHGEKCFHIIPVNDGFSHNTDSVDCCCGIKGDWKNKVIVHSALDGRKPFKKTGDKLWQVVKGRM